MNDKTYCPSNSDDGFAFIARFCENCVREEFIHTNKDDDLKCDILSRSMLYDYKDDEYPDEWIWDEDDNPTCTAFVKRTRRFDPDEPREVREKIERIDPNQLKLEL
jgi:hypothetical protein